MEYLTVSDVAQKMGMSEFTISGWFRKGKLPGRKIGGTWLITSEELQKYEDGVPAEEIEMVDLFDTKAAAAYLGVPTHIIYKMIDEGVLQGEAVDNRGQGTGTLVYTPEKLDAVRDQAKVYAETPPGVPVKGNPHKHLRKEGDRYYVVGTMNKEGVERSYRNLYQARQRAREAYENGPLFQAGEEVVWDRGKSQVPVTVVQNVTPICAMASVKTEGGRKRKVQVSALQRPGENGSAAT